MNRGAPRSRASCTRPRYGPPRPPTLGRAPAEPWRASGLTRDGSSNQPLALELVAGLRDVVVGPLLPRPRHEVLDALGEPHARAEAERAADAEAEILLVTLGHRVHRRWRDRLVLVARRRRGGGPARRAEQLPVARLQLRERARRRRHGAARRAAVPALAVDRHRRRD